MATIRRNPMSVGTNSLSEQYMNFLEYKGLNTNKNYVSIDQETFTEANNVYVNQENQLSTRPPEEIFIMTAGWQAIKVWKINDKTFYHVKYLGESNTIKGLTQNTYYLACPALWSAEGFQLYETTETIYLCWLNFAYCLFESNKITAIVYGNNKIDFYTNEDAVYFPITNFYVGTEVFTIDNPDPAGRYAVQSYNILTSSYKERYVFDPTTRNTLTTNLIGKTVTIVISGKSYTVTWEKYTEKVFYAKIGQTKAFEKNTAYNIKYQTAVSNAGPVFVITRERYERATTPADLTENYISVDGNNWYQFSIPGYSVNTADDSYDFTPLQYPVLSKQGGYIYYITYVAKGTISFKEIIYRKAIVGKELSNFNTEAWSVFKECQISTDPFISVSSKTSANNKLVVAKYILPAKAYMNMMPNIKPAAYGSADDYTAMYCLSFTHAFIVNVDWASGTFPQGSKYYYDGYLLTIADSSTYNIRLNVLNWSDSVSTTGFYSSDFATGNYNNKLDFIVLGSSGILTWYIIGHTVDNNSIMTTIPTILSNLNVIGRFVTSPQEFIADSIKYQVVGFRAGGNKLNDATNDTDIAGSQQNLITYDAGLTLASIVRTGYLYTISITKMLVTDIKQINDLSFYKDYTTSPNDTIRAQCPFTWVYSIPHPNWKYDFQGDGTIPFNAIIPALSNDAILFYDAVQYNDGKDTVKLLEPGKPLYASTEYLLWTSLNTNSSQDKLSGGTIYSNQYTETVSVDNLVKGSIDYIMPEHSVDFITTCLSQGNVFYQSSKTLIDTDITQGKNLFYIPKNTKNDNIFTDKITALVNFSQTALGIFLETTAYQLTYDSGNDVYYLSKTKLALGNRDGADMLLSYDGNNIYITTLKGLSTLNYQDFVQSTEQIYRYLTEAIMDTYHKYAAPTTESKGIIKLCQYKDWLLLYKQDSTKVLVFDLRSSSWWVWTLYKVPKQIVYINDSIFKEALVVINEDDVYTFNFEKESVYDGAELVPFNWSFTTQKMHFGAPNNYKHIRSVSIVTEQSGKPLRFKLKFTNYRNLNNLSDSDTVEYDIDQLTTMIKRVNFIKTNAFQLQVSNDKTDKYPQAFVTPNIAIKYRITERLR